MNEYLFKENCLCNCDIVQEKNNKCILFKKIYLFFWGGGWFWDIIDPLKQYFKKSIFCSISEIKQKWFIKFILLHLY